MGSNPRVTLMEPWLRRSRQWGERSSLDYILGKKEASRKYARPGIDTDPKWQILGKMGECAYALYLRLDPYESIDWGPVCDRGIDLLPPKQLADHLVKHIGIDVKTSTTDYLIWPVTKTFQSPADIFTLAVPIEHGSITFELCGWVTVDQFTKHHDTAPPPNHFDPGTPHLHRSMLWPATDLIAPNALDIIRDKAQREIIKQPDKPPYQQPGFVGSDPEGHFVHYCWCGQWGSFGVGCFLLRGKLGTWFCREHRPPPVISPV